MSLLTISMVNLRINFFILGLFQTVQNLWYLLTDDETYEALTGQEVLNAKVEMCNGIDPFPHPDEALGLRNLPVLPLLLH